LPVSGLPGDANVCLQVMMNGGDGRKDKSVVGAGTGTATRLNEADALGFLDFRAQKCWQTRPSHCRMECEN
jgi:hypothetical protein